jgi:hypothetical protein
VPVGPAGPPPLAADAGAVLEHLLQLLDLAVLGGEVGLHRVRLVDDALRVLAHRVELLLHALLVTLDLLAQLRVLLLEIRQLDLHCRVLLHVRVAVLGLFLAEMHQVGTLALEFAEAVR